MTRRLEPFDAAMKRFNRQVKDAKRQQKASAKPALEYMEKRQLSGAVGTRFGIGYADGYNELPDYLKSKGYTTEEMKMVNETRKILGDDNIKITATTVRVPVFDSHSESINIEFYNDFDLSELKEILAKARQES